MKPVSVLVNKAKKGDGEAFVTLVKQYEQVLYKVASRLLRNEQDVADAMQKAVIKKPHINAEACT
ncbi:helix-turn-helix domain-containing protein [Metabacillus sp. GX 13764]|uniref:RNA polymerase sigma factor n=1 Tax=Metabacillus kandeliae TaxID=2900151 RepID=UPI001E5DC746|nr:helix-turn-helix domain-containing protein [Metabacillus kandeliae]MCD7036007.1 helix-turn-helix domain-containing protein [Metabacillus kandeliae]